MTLGNLFVDDVADAAVGLFENDVYQLAGVHYVSLYFDFCDTS